MRTTVINRAHGYGDVLIMRPSVWGNPFTWHGSPASRCWVPSRHAAIDAFEAYLFTQPHLMARVHELYGKVLMCCCKPLPCHGDVLARYADDIGAREHLRLPIWRHADVPLRRGTAS